MAEWSIASDLKSEGLKRFREFESHSLLKIKKLIRLIFLFSFVFNLGIEKVTQKY